MFPIPLLHLCGSASQPAARAAAQPPAGATRLSEGYLACTQPRMPSLRRMHEIVAADPRAQAKFFLLMSELHYRFIVGIERLHIGRAVLARPLRPVQDDVASSLQPCIAPGTTDVQAPLEAQGRGFTHGHGKGHSVIGATPLPQASRGAPQPSSEACELPVGSFNFVPVRRLRAALGDDGQWLVGHWQRFVRKLLGIRPRARRAQRPAWLWRIRHAWNRIRWRLLLRHWRVRHLL